MAARRRLTRWPARPRAVAAAAAFLVAVFATGAASGTRTARVPAATPTSLDAAHSLALHADGTIVAAGPSSNECERSCTRWDGFAVARYLADGRLDRRFGSGGRALVELGDAHDVDPANSGGRVSAAAQPDGMTVVAGGNSWVWFKLLRLTRAGRPDARFGRGGVTEAFAREDCGAAARALALQADGKIIVAGECLHWEEEWQEALLARYTADGRLDASFGEGGSVLTALGGLSAAWRAVAIQPDGRIVVAGERERVDGERLLARYLPDGQLDASFGSGGMSTGGAGTPYALALQRDGAIVVAGAGIARYLPDGDPDPSFGGGARVPTGFVYADGGLAIQPDGRIVAAGTVKRGNQYDFAVRRYAHDGSPDPSFGGGGVITDLRGRRRDDIASDVAVQSDGAIVVAGSTWPAGFDEYPADFALARHTPEGRLDSRFGARGAVLTNFDARVLGFASFTATRRRGAVVVRWRTSAEDGIRGFHLYRGGTGPASRVTRRLIRSRGGPARGASYVFRDRGAPAQRAGYTYYLQEIKLDGRIIRRASAWVRR